MAVPTQYGKQSEKVFANPIMLKAQLRLCDKVCLGLGTLGALWLAVLLAVTTPRVSWSGVVAIILGAITAAILLTVALSFPKATDWTNR